MLFKIDHDFSFFDSVFDILQNYGWYILFSVVSIFYIINLLRPRIDKFLQWRSDQEYMAKYHKDPDLFSQRLTAQTNRIVQLQEQYEKDAERYRANQQKNEAKKAEEIKKKYEDIDVGTKLGSSQNENGKSLKPEYNPLMGGSSRSYRPTRKSPCSGGGCGR